MRNKIQHPIKKGNTIFLCQYLVPGLVQNDWLYFNKIHFFVDKKFFEKKILKMFIN
jgi:hypothetical protein